MVAAPMVVALFPYAALTALMHAWTLLGLYCRVPDAIAWEAPALHWAAWYDWHVAGSNVHVEETWQIAFAYAVQYSVTSA
jgi:hypothetical protein